MRSSLLPPRIVRMALQASPHLLPYRCRLPLCWRRNKGIVSPDQFLVGHPTPDDCAQHIKETHTVSRLPRVEPIRLFVQIAEQVERFDRNVCPLDRAFQQRPEVFQAVGVDVPTHIGFGMVNDCVNVGVGQSIIGLERIGVNVSARLYVRPDFRCMPRLTLPCLAAPGLAPPCPTSPCRT